MAKHQITTTRKVIDGGTWTQVYHDVFADGAEIGAAFEHKDYVNFEGDSFTQRYGSLEEMKAALGRRNWKAVVRLYNVLNKEA